MRSFIILLATLGITACATKNDYQPNGSGEVEVLPEQSPSEQYREEKDRLDRERDMYRSF